MANTYVYNKHDYVTSLRERLNKPTNWTDILNVKISDVRTIVTGALTVEPALQSGTRGTAYTYQDSTIAATTLTISSYENLPIFIDEADRTQQAYWGSPEIADYHGRKTNERVQALMLAQHASWVDFGATDLSNTGDDDTTQITVSASNIDDLIRAIKRKVRVNNGDELAVEHGYFSVWRAQDLELLEAFVQANGFSAADVALKSGVPSSFFYLGMNHYLSTDHTANHLFAGVRKVGKDLGLLRGTWGKVKFLENPATADGELSGLGVVSRLDYGFAFPSDATPATQRVQEMCMDINVA